MSSQAKPYNYISKLSPISSSDSNRDALVSHKTLYSVIDPSDEKKNIFSFNFAPFVITYLVSGFLHFSLFEAHQSEIKKLPISSFWNFDPLTEQGEPANSINGIKILIYLTSITEFIYKLMFSNLTCQKARS